MRNLFKTFLKCPHKFLNSFPPDGEGGAPPPWTIPPILLIFVFNPFPNDYAGKVGREYDDAYLAGMAETDY